MKKIPTSFFRRLIIMLFLCPHFLWAINITDTRLLSQPAISADHIAFIYAQDLWIANTDGS